jgi:hypothetical protein
MKSSANSTSPMNVPIIHEVFTLGEQSTAVDQDTNSTDSNPASSNIECPNNVSFRVTRFRPKLIKENKPELATDDKGNIVVDVKGSTFYLTSWVRTSVEPGITRKVAKSWTLGFIQNVIQDEIIAKASEPSNRDKVTDCQEYKQNGVLLDCNSNSDCRPFYSCATKQALALLPRRVTMDDTPSFNPKLLSPDGSILKSVNRIFKARAHLVAFDGSSPCVLKSVLWGFTQNIVFSPPSSGLDAIALALGPFQQTISPMGPSEFDQNGGQSIKIDGPCANTLEPNFHECAGDSQKDLSNSPALLKARISESEDRVSESKDQNNDQEESQSTLLTEQDTKQAIEEYDKCSGTATVECRGGIVAPVLPSCVQSAPCGINECVERHEQSHAKDITDWFAVNLGRSPCKHPDGRPYPDGSTVYANEMAEAMGNSKYMRWLNRSECQGYGEEVRCYRELRKKSQDRRCKRALTRESTGAIYRRIGFCLGINLAGPR